MKNRISGVIWGLAFIVAGVGFAGNAFDLWDFNIFFDGWWTLFIIVPCIATLIQSGLHTAPLIGLLAGVLLFLSAQGFLPRHVVAKLFVPAVLLLIGVRILFGHVFGRSFPRYQPHVVENQNSGGGRCEACSILSGRTERVTGRFDGAVLTAIFGGVDLDLRDALIDHDVSIEATAIFGGVEIKVPPHVRVQLTSLPIFGGADNKAPGPAPGTPCYTVFVNATCIFGGVDVK